MNLLVISSCTGEKNVRNCPLPLREEDFNDASLFMRREAELSEWRLPAATLYTGWQHRYMVRGLNALRLRFGTSCCTLKIISAGYGLVEENQTLIPYEVSFKGKSSLWIRKRAERLGIPEAVRKSVLNFDAVVFLLGKEYLLSMHPPVVPDRNQRFAFFTSNLNLPFDAAATIVPAGKSETRFGAGLVALKGKMFELFAYGLCANPELWNLFLADKTPATVLNAVEVGLKRRGDHQ